MNMVLTITSTATSCSTFTMDLVLSMTTRVCESVRKSIYYSPAHYTGDRHCFTFLATNDAICCHYKPRKTNIDGHHVHMHLHRGHSLSSERSSYTSVDNTTAH